MRIKFSQVIRIVVLAALLILSFQYLAMKNASAANDFCSPYGGPCASDQNGGVYMPKTKLSFGPSGGPNVDVSGSDPLPVSANLAGVTITAAPTGTRGSVVRVTLTTTPTAIVPPSGTTGFIFESESGNNDNVRWSAGSTSSTTAGQLYEPGRDSGFVPNAATISATSTANSPKVTVQWLGN